MRRKIKDRSAFVVVPPAKSPWKVKELARRAAPQMQYRVALSCGHAGYARRRGQKTADCAECETEPGERLILRPTLGEDR